MRVRVSTTMGREKTLKVERDLSGEVTSIIMAREFVWMLLVILF